MSVAAGFDPLELNERLDKARERFDEFRGRL
jgi:hypothetical protein